ncbi:MAG TPA: TM0106 family RecB-like putative nuclease [Candidatus Limnocylindrales bacterium]
MQLIDGKPVYAATDLVGFLACEHLTALERAALAGLTKRPERNDPELDVIRKRGIEHEKRYLAGLREAGKSVVPVELDGSIEDRGDQLRRAAAETIAAMRSGADVVYQATFFDGTWRGHADFLLRVASPEKPSVWGPWHYEVADTKLARHVKASAVLQICSYVDQLERLQGIQPVWMHVALGGSAATVERLRVDDFMAYYRMAKARFLATVTTGEPVFPIVASYPEPVDHCDVCRWAVECSAQRRADDHLSLVAGISGRQRRALVERDVATLADLGVLALPMNPRLDGTSPQALERVREQARIQLEGRIEGRMKYELLLPKPGEPIEQERGIAILPPPSPGDLFFDIEGDPYAFEDGLDYLFGILETDGTFTAIWSRDGDTPDAGFSLAAEKVAFERFIDFVIERLDRDPSLHVYHYAAYEPTALKRLMGRYGTREAEVDRLLRGGVLVDLHRAVRQSLRASVESYSIKKIEPLYDFVRDVDLRDAGSSIVAFEAWLELGETERPGSEHLAKIERYNRDDVRSNAALRDWLETLRDELARQSGQEVPRPGPREQELPADLSEQQAQVRDTVEALGGLAADPSVLSPERRARWLLAQLLGWHRREDKAMWWEFFRWVFDLTPEELVDESDPLGMLTPIGQVGETPRGKEIWRYRYPAQEFEVRGTVYDPARALANREDRMSAWSAGEVVAVDELERTIDIKRSPGGSHPEAIVPLNNVGSKDQRASLLAVAEWVLANGIDSPGEFRAARDLLLGRPPRVGQRPGESIGRPSETDLEAARRLALALDHTTLPIQGPPGSGKTYSGARMICTLLAAGKRVGITANSHKVIGNLLSAVLDAATKEGVAVRAIQRHPEDVIVVDDRVIASKGAAEAREMLDSGAANLAAGTAWFWASPALRESVDVLFVDEAGQMSLANAVAVSPAGKSLVLLGDPQQLDQPLRGSHPPGAEKSALGHFLGRAATIEPHRGLFLEKTWRLHPELCRFTSEVFYDNRLEPEPHLVRQRLNAQPPVDGVGPRLMGRATAGFDNESPDEADDVAELATALVGTATWIDADGEQRPVTWQDVLIVAPYNAQVGAIAKRLPAEARVGTVDKFQGQEAPISIYSMTTSSPDLAPRGMDFLYSRHRLNVATSRARCVAVVVASPELLRVRARTPAQMRLANALCRFVELAGAATPVPVSAGRAP